MFSGDCPVVTKTDCNVISIDEFFCIWAAGFALKSVSECFVLRLICDREGRPPSGNDSTCPNLSKKAGNRIRPPQWLLSSGFLDLCGWINAFKWMVFL